MANCIAKASGQDKTRRKDVQRLGSESAFTEAASWHTKALGWVNKDGSGYVEVHRDGKVIHSWAFGPEDKN